MAALSETFEIFNNLSAKITQLLYGRGKTDRNLVTKTLKDLNSINYKYPMVLSSGTKAALLINQCCSIIPPDDTELVAPCCQLITSLITQQNVLLNGTTRTMCVEWCLGALKGENSDIGVLIALEAVARSSSESLLDTVMKNQFFNELSKLEPSNLDLILHYLQCLEACTTLPDNRVHSPECFAIFVNFLMDHDPSPESLSSTKILTVSLRALQNIVTQCDPSLVEKNLGIILGVVRSYIVYKITGIEFIKPEKLCGTTLNLPEPAASPMRDKKGGKVMKQRKPKSQGRKSVTLSTSHDDLNLTPVAVKTSDSDFSDSEGGTCSKLFIATGRTRQAALQLFNIIIKTSPKNTIFPYWTHFVPVTQSPGHNLVTSLLKEPSTRGRLASLNTLHSLLLNSRPYLSLAEQSSNLSFTSFSVLIGLTIVELHKSLILALGDKSVPVLAQVLKCLAVLVQATPYHKLSQGLLARVVQRAKRLVYHKDSTVQVTALIVVGCVLSVEPILGEIAQCFKLSGSSANIAGSSHDSSDCDEIDSPGNLPWIVARCLHNLDSQATPNAVKLESLQVLSTITSSGHFELLSRHLLRVARTLSVTLTDRYADVQLHGGRTVDFIAQALGPESNLDYWTCLLGPIVESLVQSEHHVLRTVGCDCLGSMGGAVYEQLPRDKQLLCVTLLFNCSRDRESSGVCGAAVRALAVWVMYPSLRDDCGFIVDTIESILRVLEDDTLGVRVKASWSLGTLSDALVINHKEHSLPKDEITDRLMLKLWRAVLKASCDHDKVKMNSVRIVGNLMQLVDSGQVTSDDYSCVITQGIQTLVKCATSCSTMKVRWNSCYALGNTLKNPVIFSLVPKNWSQDVFTTLCDLVVNFHNFKVRINAALALACPSSRIEYGSFYHQVFYALVKGLDTADNMDDLAEYKHRDNLIEQLCLSLGHLIVLIRVEDLGVLENCISADRVRVHVGRVWDKLVPERAGVLFEACARCLELERGGGLSAEQRRILGYLVDTFKRDE